MHYAAVVTDCPRHVVGGRGTSGSNCPSRDIQSPSVSKREHDGHLELPEGLSSGSIAWVTVQVTLVRSSSLVRWRRWNENLAIKLPNLKARNTQAALKCLQLCSPESRILRGDLLITKLGKSFVMLDLEKIF